MQSLWNYLWPTVPKRPERPEYICLGKWNDRIDELDLQYGDLGSRIIEYGLELGKDPYNRYYPFEALIDFAIEEDIAECSVDCIYRHYVYFLLSKVDPVDVNAEELRVLFEEFTLFPEGIQTYLDQRLQKIERARKIPVN